MELSNDLVDCIRYQDLVDIDDPEFVYTVGDVEFMREHERSCKAWIHTHEAAEVAFGLVPGSLVNWNGCPPFPASSKLPPAAK